MSFKLVLCKGFLIEAGTLGAGPVRYCQGVN